MHLSVTHGSALVTGWRSPQQGQQELLDQRCGDYDLGANTGQLQNDVEITISVCERASE